MKRKLKPGDKVQSTYRARWFGTVIARCGPSYYDENGVKVEKKYRHTHNCRVFHIPNKECCLVRVEEDSCHRPQRKVFFEVIDMSWLKKLDI